MILALGPVPKRHTKFPLIQKEGMAVETLTG